MVTDPYKPIALVVEDDVLQRLMVATLLEDSDMDVVQCESGEAAELVLNKIGGCLCLLFTDVNLSGSVTGDELANLVAERYPRMKIIVTSARGPPPLPRSALFMGKPWNPETVVREAKAARF